MEKQKQRRRMVRNQDGEGGETTAHIKDQGEQGRDIQGRDIQGREVQGREVQGREVQGREVQGREVQGQEAQGQEVQGQNVMDAKSQETWHGMLGAKGGKGAGGDGGQARGGLDDSSGGAFGMDSLSLDDLTIPQLALKLCRARLMAEVLFVHHRVITQQSTTLGLTHGEAEYVYKRYLEQRLKQMEIEDQVQLIQLLWEEDQTEFHHVAVHLLTDVTIPITRKLSFKHLFDLLKHLITTCGNKTLVDHIAQCHVNALVFLEPSDTLPVIDQWAAETNEPWLQRTAILHQLSLGKYASKERLFRYCDLHLGKNRPHEDILNGAVAAALEKYATSAFDENDTGDDLKACYDALADVVRYMDLKWNSMSPKLQDRLANLRLDLRKKEDDISNKRRQILIAKRKARK